MFSLFPPPPKPPKRNYIQENIKHLQSLQSHHKQDGGNAVTFKKKLNPLSRPVPKQKSEEQETVLSNYVSTTKIVTHGQPRPVKQNSVQGLTNNNKKNTKFNFRTNLKLPSITNNTISTNQRVPLSVRSPKRRDASCQYLESDSRYYFADGSTVHFVYPSENRKSIFVKPVASVRKVERKNSVYLRTTESYRRKQSNKVLANKRKTNSETVSNNYKDACCQYNETDFSVLRELPEEFIDPARSVAESNDLEHHIDIPKLNLKDSLTDLLQSDSCMASIIEAGRSSKPQESQPSTAESSVSIPIFKDEKTHLATDASVVPLVDLRQECVDAKNSERPATNEELMKKLKNQFSKRVDELNHMPMRSDTLRARTRKIQLEKELMELERNIKHLSYPKARVDLRAIS